MNVSLLISLRYDRPMERSDEKCSLDFNVINDIMTSQLKQPLLISALSLPFGREQRIGASLPPSPAPNI